MRLLARVVVLLLAAGVGVVMVDEGRPDGPEAAPALPPEPTMPPPATASTVPTTTSTTRALRFTEAPVTTHLSWPLTRVRGRVVDDEGRPAGGVQVSVRRRSRGLWSGLEAIGMALGGCAGNPPPVECRSAGGGTTRPDGSYEVEVRASPAELGALEMEVAARARDGTWVARPLAVGADPQAAPDLLLWESGAMVRDGVVRWRPLPAADGGRYGVHFRIEQKKGPGASYSVGVASTSYAFDPRVLEDGAGTVAVTATSGDMVWSGADVPVRGAGAPPSRDRPCVVHPDDSGAQPVAYATCPLTDADTLTSVRARPESSRVVVDLGASRPIELVVLDHDRSFVVEVSEDGQAWVELLRRDRCTSDFRTCIAAPATPRPGRYVRLTLDKSNLWFVESLALW